MITHFFEKSAHSILIVDDTYGEVELGIRMGYTFVCCIRSVMEFYTSKNEDVAKNVIKFMLIYSKYAAIPHASNTSILELAQFVKKYDDKYPQYGEQLEKYTLLL
jgi:hypothetical protein